jgi:hypothetical protein
MAIFILQTFDSQMKIEIRPQKWKTPQKRRFIGAEANYRSA